MRVEKGGKIEIRFFCFTIDSLKIVSAHYAYAPK